MDVRWIIFAVIATLWTITTFGLRIFINDGYCPHTATLERLLFAAWLLVGAVFLGSLVVSFEFL